MIYQMQAWLRRYVAEQTRWTAWTTVSTAHGDPVPDNLVAQHHAETETLATDALPIINGLEGPIREFLEVWDNTYLIEVVGPALNCAEAEVFQDFLMAVGASSTTIDVLMKSHAGSDDVDDQHYLGRTL